MSCACIRCAYI